MIALFEFREKVNCRLSSDGILASKVDSDSSSACGCEPPGRTSFKFQRVIRVFDVRQARGAIWRPALQ